MNHYYKYLLADFGRNQTEKTRTASTVASQQNYQVSVDTLFPKTITVTSGTTKYPVEEVESQDSWDHLNLQTMSGIPRFFFYRPKFGIGGGEISLYPTPDAVYTLTLVSEVTDKDLSASSYTTGTITVTNGDATVTGSGTTFSAAMVGRYFRSNGSNSDGLWYKIATFTSTTELELENVYEGTTQSGGTYQIDEAFALPEEMQVLPIYGAVAEYYATKGNEKQELKFRGIFNAGHIAGKRRYGTKTRSNIIRSKRELIRGRFYRPNITVS